MGTQGYSCDRLALHWDSLSPYVATVKTANRPSRMGTLVSRKIRKFLYLIGKRHYNSICGILERPGPRQELAMYWQYTPYVWIYAVAALLGCGMGAYAWKHRNIPGAAPFAITQFSAALWSIANALESSRTDLPSI